MSIFVPGYHCFSKKRDLMPHMISTLILHASMLSPMLYSRCPLHAFYMLHYITLCTPIHASYVLYCLTCLPMCPYMPSMFDSTWSPHVLYTCIPTCLLHASLCAPTSPMYSPTCLIMYPLHALYVPPTCPPCVSYVLPTCSPTCPHVLSGYHIDTLNQCQCHQGHSQGQDHLANSLIYMSLLYNTPS